MKKIFSLILALVMLSALAVPAWAEWFESGKVAEGTYYALYMQPNSEVTINSAVVIKSTTYLGFEGDNIVLTIGKGGSLTGKDILLDFIGSNHKIVIKDGGWLDLTFHNARYADSFSAFLTENGIEFERDGDRITVSTCGHDHTTTVETTVETTVKTTTTTVCDDCGYEDTKTVTETSTKTYVGNPMSGSTFSEGNMTIVLCTVCLAIGVVGGLLIEKNRKSKEIG